MWQLLSLCDRYYGCIAFAGFSIYLVITDVSAWLNFCEPRFSIYTSSIFGHALLKDGSESFISMILWSPSSGMKRISCLMKVITASLKHCNKRFWTFLSRACLNIKLVYHNHCYYDPNVVHMQTQRIQYSDCLFTVISVTFNETAKTVSESDGVFQLTAVANFSQTSQTPPSFSLLVNTLDGTAIGLPWCNL